MSPIVLVAMIIAAVLMFVLPRRTVIVPFLLFTFLTPFGQQFYLGGLHFFAERIVILCGCIRFLSARSSSSGSILPGGFTGIDKAFSIWAGWRVLAFLLLYRQGGAVVNQLGFIWDTLGGYFLVRYLIRDKEDILRVARVFVIIAAVMAVCMTYEHYAVKNVFGLLMGGRVSVDVREGHVRCRGVFGQQILASAFGGTLVPLFLWLWKVRRAKVGAVVGVISAVVITITSSSSTGVSAFAVGVMALCLWPIRNYMRQFRWAMVAAIAGLALIMKAPVWFAIAHVDFAGGSTGWDRAHLIDEFVRHFWDWWLVGTSSYAAWGDFTWDLCNQFVGEGETAGLGTLILFILIISRSFGRIGVARKRSEGNRGREWLIWTIGALMAGHMAAFMGISYFDQTQVWWFVTLSMIPAACLAVGPIAKASKVVSGGEREYAIEALEASDPKAIANRLQSMNRQHSTWTSVPTAQK